MEETSIVVEDMKYLMSTIYPTGDNANGGVELGVYYSFVDRVEVESNYEGDFEWKNIDFAMDFNNRELAGYANIAQFMREILVKENIIKFY
ncbi:hypothetical protein D3C76_1660670 [compost metagenome]